MPEKPNKPTTDGRRLLARLRSPGALIAAARAHKLRSLFIVGGGLVALSILVAILQFSAPHGPTVDNYRAALAALDAGDHEQARAFAARMFRAPLSFEQSGAPFYILGAATGIESEGLLDTRHRNELLVLATRYLEESRLRGFPADRELDGLLRLAKYLYASGQYARCLPIINELLSVSSEPVLEAEQLLAGAYLRDSNPQLDLALVHIDKFLSASELTAERRRGGQLEKARILIALAQLQQATKLLAAVAPSETNSDLLLLQGRLALAEARRSTPPDSQALQRAAAALQSSIDRDVSNSGITPQAEYLLGVVEHELGDETAALKRLSRVRRLFEPLPEGWSAALLEGEILLARGDDEAALESLRQAAISAGDAAFYSNPWIPLVEFRSRLREAYAAWTERGEFSIANNFAKALPPLLPLEDSVQMRGDAFRLWGEALLAEAAASPLSKRTKIEAEGRKRHRTAAKLYAWLAQLRYATSYYPHDLWNSSQQYLAGHDYEQAADTLQTYLETELRERRPEALLALAKAFLSLGRLDESLKAVDDVLANYPQHPATYRVRLIGSAVHLERRKIGAASNLEHLDQARLLLEANLEEEALTPRSLEWRDSLFALGHVLSLEAIALETASRNLGVDIRDDPEITKLGLRELEKAAAAYDAAISRLDEATRRYADAPQATVATYELAEAYRNAAKLPRKKLPLVLIQTTRVQLQQQMNEQLTAAYEIYRQLQQRLNQKQEREELGPVEQSILRNCYFARADTLFDRGLYEEAIREYSTASNRYQHEPASLEAFVQIASCYRLLGRPYEARGTLEQAKVVLERIRDDADFRSTTRYERRDWEGLLELLSSL